MGLLILAASLAGAKMVSRAIENAASSSASVNNNSQFNVFNGGYNDTRSVPPPPPLRVPEQPKPPKTMVTVKCISCRAIITDYPNKRVRCDYCDTEQTIKQIDREESHGYY